MNYVKYFGRALIAVISLWILYVIAALGSPWLSLGIVGFAAFIALFTRATRTPSHRTGQPSPKRRVESTDRDRWGGGTL